MPKQAVRDKKHTFAELLEFCHECGFELVPADKIDNPEHDNPESWSYTMEIRSGSRVVMRRSQHGMTKSDMDRFLTYLDDAPELEDIDKDSGQS